MGTLWDGEKQLKSGRKAQRDGKKSSGTVNQREARTERQERDNREDTERRERERTKIEMRREKRTQRGSETLVGGGREEKRPQREGGESGDTKDGLGGVDRLRQRDSQGPRAAESPQEHSGQRAGREGVSAEPSGRAGHQGAGRQQRAGGSARGCATVRGNFSSRPANLCSRRR